MSTKLVNIPDIQFRAGEVPGGVRILPPDELMRMAQDPEFRAAVDLIERVQGKETCLKRMIRKQLQRDTRTAETVFRNKRLIDRAVEHSR
jgi:hypothetical protein